MADEEACSLLHRLRVKSFSVLRSRAHVPRRTVRRFRLHGRMARDVLDQPAMRTAANGGSQLLAGVGRARARSRTGWIASALVVVAAVAVVLASASGISSETRAIRALPGEQRLSVLSRTVDELRQLCGGGRPEALRDHCRELAAFAARFDECRGDCASLVRRELAPAPTR